MYANDCIQMRRVKRIEDHSDAELNAAIERAARKFGDDFYVMLHGIDAYMERRSRRRAARIQRAADVCDRLGWLAISDAFGDG